MSQFGSRMSGPRSNFVSGPPTNASYPAVPGGGSYTTGHTPSPGGYAQPRGGYTQHDHTYENIPPDIKYPPGWQPRSGVTNENHAPVSIPRTPSGQVQVSEIVKQLDFATRENLRLKRALEDNNTFLEQKLKEISDMQNTAASANAKRVKDLEAEIEKHKGKITEATNQFFEARVAVMGFKSRVMQLQGQLDRNPDMANQHGKKLDEEKRKLADEKKSVEAANIILKEDLEALGNKKRIVDEEKDRLVRELKDQVKDKDAHIQQLNVHLAQAQADKQSYHDHTLRGQIQELTVKKGALEGEVARMKERNDHLLGKVKEMQQAKDVMIQKLERLESMSPVSTTPTTPTPAPRTSSNAAERERLEGEVRRLQEEVSTLRAERDRANRDKLAVDEMFQGSNRKSQNLTEEVFNLQGELSQLKQQLEEEQHRVKELESHGQEMQRSLQVEASQSLQQLRQECEGLRADLRNMTAEKKSQDLKVSSLTRERDANIQEVEILQQSREEIRRKSRKYENDIAQLEEKLAMGTEHTELKSASFPSGMKLSSSIAKKLNDAVGKIKELEAGKRHLEEELGDNREENARQLRQHNVSLEVLKEELQAVRKESTKMATEDVEKLQVENRELHAQEQTMTRRLQSLEAEQQRQVEESLRLRSDVDRYRQELAQQDTENRGMTRQISESDIERSRLKQQVRELTDQLEAEAKTKDRKSNKLDTLQKSYSDLKTNHTGLQVSNQQVVAELEEKSRLLQTSTSEKTRIQAEKEDLQNTCEEFRKESESILQDYNSCAQRLKVAQEEAARWNTQHQKDMTELARQKDRIGLLERSRKEQEERLSHMDQQIQIYHEDFDRERNAREAAVKVKNLAEDRMKKMDKELKELRDRLNQQAVHSLRDEPVTYDDGGYSTSSSSSRVDTMPSSSQRYNKSGEQQYQPSPGWNAPTPPSQGAQHHHMTPPHSQEQPPRRSGEQPNYSPAQGMGSENTGPSLSSNYGRAPFRAGAGGGGGGAGPHNVPWTTQMNLNPAINPSGITHNPHYHGSRTVLDPPRGDHMPGPHPPTINDLNNPPLPTSSSQAQGPATMDPYQQGARQLDTYLGRPADTYQGRPADTYQPRQAYSGPEPVHVGVEGVGPPVGGAADRVPVGGLGHLIPIQDDGRHNQAPPTMACPICSRADFKTTGELVQHSATCT